MNTADNACNKLKNRSGNPFKAVTRRFSQSASDLSFYNKNEVSRIIHTAHFIFISVLIYEAKLQLKSIPTIRADKLDYIPGMYSFPTTSLSPEKSTSKKWGTRT